MKIKVYALSRSGHHAITFWLAGNIVPNAKVTAVSEGKTYDMRAGDESVTLEMHENEELVPSDEPSILIVRDPYNSYASFLHLVQNPNFGPLSFFPYMKRWQEYAKEALRETNLLSGKKMVISYSQWTASEPNRRHVSGYFGHRFGVKTKFNDAEFERMPGQGGGSSFDGLSFNGMASQMRVHERYKKYENNRAYLNEVNTPEVRRLSEALFNFFPLNSVEESKPRDTQMLFDNWFLS